MKQTSIPLLTLLEFLFDQFDTVERGKVETILRNDSVAKARFVKLRDLAIESQRAPNLAGFSVADGPVPSAEKIAAFLDRRLNSEDSFEFENSCWQSPVLLQFIVELFRTNHDSPVLARDQEESGIEVPANSQLRDRLLELFPGPAVTANSPNAEAATLIPADSSESFGTGDKQFASAEVGLGQSKGSSDHGVLASSTILRLALSAAATIVVVVAAVFVYGWAVKVDSPTVIVESASQPDKHPDSLTAPELVENEDVGPDIVLPESHFPPRVVDSVDPNGSLPNQDALASDPVVRKPPERESPERLADRPEPPPREPVSDMGEPLENPGPEKSGIRWTWNRIEGLAAVRPPGTNRWSGALAGTDRDSYSNETSGVGGLLLRVDEGLECRLLPLSWAQADVAAFGDWTITANSEFSLVPVSSPMPNRPSSDSDPGDSMLSPVRRLIIRLSQGRIAISNAELNSVLQIETATGDWTVRFTEPESVLVVEQGQTARLMIQKGAARVNKIDLVARQQLVRTSSGELQQLVSRETVKWINKPEAKFPSKEFAKQWLNSDDLLAEMSRGDSVAPGDRHLARAALATIDPPGQAAEFLANVVPQVRAEGIRWLLVYGQDQQRLRRLAAELADQWNTPSLRATIPRMVLAINRKRMPAKSDSEALVALLQNRNAPVRRLAHGLLVHLFGTLERYNAEADASSRNLQARKWLVAINSLYRRIDRARQR